MKIDKTIEKLSPSWVAEDPNLGIAQKNITQNDSDISRFNREFNREEMERFIRRSNAKSSSSKDGIDCHMMKLLPTLLITHTCSRTGEKLSPHLLTNPTDRRCDLLLCYLAH